MTSSMASQGLKEGPSNMPRYAITWKATIGRVCPLKARYLVQSKTSCREQERGKAKQHRADPLSLTAQPVLLLVLNTGFLKDIILYG